MAITPTRKYETLGHAAPGKGVNEYAAGFEVGHHAISISPSLFVSAGYKYSAEFHVDYLLTSRVALRASTMWQHTHGGLDLPLTGPAAAQHAHHHDQLARSNFWHGSLGISYGLTPTLDVSQVPLLERRDRLAVRSLELASGTEEDGRLTGARGASRTSKLIVSPKSSP